MRPSPQPWSAARMKPYTRAVIPTVEVSAPTRSNRPEERGVSLMNSGARTTSATPIGTLMKSTHRQDSQSVRTPPATSPSAAPEPDTAA